MHTSSSRTVRLLDYLYTSVERLCEGGSLDFLPCSATFNLHPLYLCSYPVFVCSGESYLCKIGRQYFSRQQRRITPEVPSDSLRFLEDRQQAWFELKKKLCKTAVSVKGLFFRHGVQFLKGFSAPPLRKPS